MPTGDDADCFLNAIVYESDPVAASESRVKTPYPYPNVVLSIETQSRGVISLPPELGFYFPLKSNRCDDRIGSKPLKTHGQICNTDHSLTRLFSHSYQRYEWSPEPGEPVRATAH